MKVTSSKREVAEVYSYRFDDCRCRWAVFTLCEMTGQLSIESDAGAWSYYWPNHGRPSLKAFLAEGDAHYVLGKFELNGGSDLADVFDEDASAADVRAEIVRARRDHEIAKDEARDLWTQIPTEGPEVGAWLAAMPEDLYRFLEEPWAFARTRPSAVFELMANEVLPFFFRALRAELEEVSA